MARSCYLSSAVMVSAAPGFDTDHGNDPSGLIDLVENPVAAPASAPCAMEGWIKRFTNSTGVLQEMTIDEFIRCPGDTFGKTSGW